LAPYCNNYNEWVQYQTYDLTEVLGKNGQLSVLLGNGWYKGRFGFDNDSESNYYGTDWKLLAELHVQYTDGSEEIFGTDESWLVKRSTIYFSDIYDGEQRDDTLPDLPEEKVMLCEPPLGQLTARLSTPVTIHEKFNPVNLITTPAGETVLDLG
ncbi:alpha-L-rhamnosidase N-terminal domain-containing protein, partial [Glutamicibacter protophormiae]